MIAWNRELPTIPKKEQAPCCMARLDRRGRPPIGFCSPDCIRRQARATRHALAHRWGLDANGGRS